MEEESGVKRLVLKIKASNPNEDHEEHVCDVCNKGFVSGKALRGHMRIHATPDNTNQLDLSASLPPGWAVTAKRGRKRLASCKSSSPLLPGIQQRILKSVVDIYSVVYINLNHRDRNDAIDDDEILDKKKRRKRTRKMELFESETAKRNSYRCSICSKSFTSYQALGGHKSSHYYQAMNTQITNQNQSSVFKSGCNKNVSTAEDDFGS